MHLIRHILPSGKTMFYEGTSGGATLWGTDIKQAQPYADRDDAEKAIAMTQPFKGLVKLGHQVVSVEIKPRRSHE